MERIERGGKAAVAAALALGLTLAVLLAGGLLAAPGSARAAGGAIVLSPRPGEVLRGNSAGVRVRSGQQHLEARLNGQRLSGEFGGARHGVRALRASLSQGLRGGRNVLRVTLRRHGRPVRRQTVRFEARSRQPLLGAGRDETVGVGETVHLAGEAGGGPTGELHWTLVSAPRTGVPGETPAESANLTSAAGIDASLRPQAPGTYALRLGAGPAEGARRDLTRVEVMPRNKLVPIETMIAGPKDPGGAGIEVGGTTFLLNDAEERPPETDSRLQVLVLKRKDLQFVSNREYGSLGSLGGDLAALDPGYLVIAVLQPTEAQPRTTFDRKQLNDALAAIGTPDYGLMPNRPGGFSVIGIPKLARGFADVNVLRQEVDQPARMSGYLTPDQSAGWGFVPSLSERFDYAAKPKPACSERVERCLERIGFRIRVQNSRTLEPGPGDGRFFATGQSDVAMEAMSSTLEAVPFEDVVQIEAVGERLPREEAYRPPVGRVPPKLMKRLAGDVAALGGTRNAFNRVASSEGSLASGGSTYFLVGWKGAAEGEGAEAAANVYGEGPAPSLHGILRPDLQSRLRPAQVSPAGRRADLAEIVMGPPINAWPLDDDPGAAKALAYLGATTKFLGPDPRSAYWSQPYLPSKWNDLARQLEAVAYAGLPGAERGNFTQGEFEDAQEELVEELRWVANVREYLANLAEPFDQNVFGSWEQAQTIADDIYKETQASNGQTFIRWSQFASILLKASGPITSGIGTALAATLDLGVWGFGAEQDGMPTGTETRLKADEVGKFLADEMRKAAETFAQVGDVIVSDPAKLKLVGEGAGCVPTAPQCDPQFSLTKNDQRIASALLSRSVQRLAYEKLLPLGYHVYELAPDRHPEVVGGKPRNPQFYGCGLPYPWYYYSPLALKYATTALLQEFDTLGTDNSWQILAMSQPLGGYVHGTPPSDELLKHLFEPAPSGDGPSALDPNAPLGISAEGLMARSKWDKSRNYCTWYTS